MSSPSFSLIGAALDIPGTSAIAGDPIGAIVGDPGTSAAVADPTGGMVGDPVTGAPMGDPGASAAAGKTGAAAAVGKTGAAVGKTGTAASFGGAGTGSFGKLTGVGAFGKLSGGKLVAGGAAPKLLSGVLVFLAIPFLSIGLLIAGVFTWRRLGKEPKARAGWQPPKVRRMGMGRLIRERIVLVILGLITLLVGVTGASIAYQHFKTYKVVIAAGSPKAESYVLMQALKTVAERHYPRLKITVRETGGSTESLASLDRGEAQFATTQADVPAGPSARAVAVLYCLIRAGAPVGAEFPRELNVELAMKTLHAHALGIAPRFRPGLDSAGHSGFKVHRFLGGHAFRPGPAQTLYPTVMGIAHNVFAHPSEISGIVEHNYDIQFNA